MQRIALLWSPNPTRKLWRTNNSSLLRAGCGARAQRTAASPRSSRHRERIKVQTHKGHWEKSCRNTLLTLKHEVMQLEFKVCTALNIAVTKLNPSSILEEKYLYFQGHYLSDALLCHRICLSTTNYNYMKIQEKCALKGRDKAISKTRLRCIPAIQLTK